MDTRFWGPSGWRLLHSITFAYMPRTDKVAVREMFNALPYVLPCKYCRFSLSEHMEELPLEPALESRELLTLWLWKIHNRVNAKLRAQRINQTQEDPPFEKVKEYYTFLLNTGCTRTIFPGWEFLFSIADLHPMSTLAKKSQPISGAPLCEHITSIEEKNKWNCMSHNERLPYYQQFWKYIGLTLPFKEWRDIWISAPCNLDSRISTTKWLWKLRCSMETELELLNKCNFASLCKNLQSYRSDCSKSARGKTCRKRR